ncbi:hypothetical protein F383_29512 [Gossypium arboreum]|uniref:Uncharacterized protein n=1 Tax=Gossypium arboreum TaxID=29729 RepID=A0A0B0MJR5_GOSAR|nr:hypothetical protein F383_39036 [Gossypium arboreum]KHG23951.1 hypothetical protein F383_29512 [Gossypium arboreum]
MFMFEIELGKS